MEYEYALSKALLFQSTPPRGGRRGRSGLDIKGRHFNPRPHAGGDVYQVSCRPDTLPISIHAPTRGATQLFPIIAKVQEISIHAPTRGATTRIKRMRRTVRISIHAPTRGATASTSSPVCWGGYFNPRPHAGGDSKKHVFPPKYNSQLQQHHQTSTPPSLFPLHIPPPLSYFAGANLPGQPCPLPSRTLLYHKNPLCLIRFLDPKMLHLCLIFIPQIIESQAVLLLIDQGYQLIL